MKNYEIVRSGKGFFETADSCLYNTRLKYCPDGAGGFVLTERIVTKYPVFNPHGCELVRLPNVFDECCDFEVSQEQLDYENRLRSMRRSRAKFYDLVRCNLDMNFFVTLTFDGSLVNRSDYDSVIKKFNVFCANRVRRYGLKYVGVVERHKQSNGLHFHLISNGAWDLFDSGTVRVIGHKKPIKISTADRYGIPADMRQIVYNTAAWKWGYSTALNINNDDLRIKTGHYLLKYLTKNSDKIGGRWYYSGGQLSKPLYRYDNTGFFDNPCDDEYEFEICGNIFRINKCE